MHFLEEKLVSAEACGRAWQCLAEEAARLPGNDERPEVRRAGRERQQEVG
jgi:hypothetical protein